MAEIYCANGSIVLVDDEAFEAASQHNWQIAQGRPGRTAATRGRRHFQSLAVFIWSHFGRGGAGPIYSISGDRLDCRLSNLTDVNPSDRVALMAKRNRNMPPTAASGLKGLSQQASGRWQAMLGGVRTRVGLGTYCTADAAARAYDAAAFQAWGTDCYLNFPEDFGLPTREPKS